MHPLYLVYTQVVRALLRNTDLDVNAVPPPEAYMELVE